MALNISRGETAAFDPYPFILLNLVLSCLRPSRRRSS